MKTINGKNIPTTHQLIDQMIENEQDRNILKSRIDLDRTSQDAKWRNQLKDMRNGLGYLKQ